MFLFKLISEGCIFSIACAPKKSLSHTTSVFLFKDTSSSYKSYLVFTLRLSKLIHVFLNGFIHSKLKFNVDKHTLTKVCFILPALAVCALTDSSISLHLLCPVLQVQFETQQEEYSALSQKAVE